MTAVAAWSEVEDRLMEQVFYRHDPDQVRVSHDLAHDGLIDSLSVVSALEVLLEASGNDLALDIATPADFLTVGAIEDLYDRLCREPA